jgi:hypothetical protein
MTNWTVGAAGTYATWGDAIAALAAASPLADDYTIMQTSDTVETATSFVNSVDLNGHTVVCGNASPHNGDPTQGYKATSITAGVCILYVNLSGAGSFEVKDLQCACNCSGAPYGIYLNKTGGSDIFVHDCIATNAQAAGSGIFTDILSDAPASEHQVWNCATAGWNVSHTFYLSYLANHVLENCSSQGTIRLLGTTATGAVVQSCVAAHFEFGGAPSIAQGFNNASVDATAANANWAAGSAGNLTGVVLLDEFETVTIGEALFFKVQSGGVCENGGASPLIAANTEGNRGTPRPHGAYVTIGADEAEAAVSTGGASGGTGSMSMVIQAAMAMGY